MLPIFPVILSGTVAGILASTLEPAHAFPILICGFTFQGKHLGNKVPLHLTCYHKLIPTVHRIRNAYLYTGHRNLLGPPL